MDYVDSPQLWRVRAREACLQAEDARDPDARRLLQAIARKYDQLAAGATERLLSNVANLAREHERALGPY